jgi:hypothetical protein
LKGDSNVALSGVGNGSEQNPYQITTADEFMTVVETNVTLDIMTKDMVFILYKIK